MSNLEQRAPLQRVSLRAEPDVCDAIRATARADRRSISSFLRCVVLDHVERRCGEIWLRSTRAMPCHAALTVTTSNNLTPSSTHSGLDWASGRFMVFFGNPWIAHSLRRRHRIGDDQLDPLVGSDHENIADRLVLRRGALGRVSRSAGAFRRVSISSGRCPRSSDNSGHTLGFP
jgi:hypothetical protein